MKWLLPVPWQDPFLPYICWGRQTWMIRGHGTALLPLMVRRNILIHWASTCWTKRGNAANRLSSFRDDHTVCPTVTITEERFQIGTGYVSRHVIRVSLFLFHCSSLLGSKHIKVHTIPTPNCIWNWALTGGFSCHCRNLWLGCRSSLHRKQNVKVGSISTPICIQILGCRWRYIRVEHDHF